MADIKDTTLVALGSATLIPIVQWAVVDFPSASAPVTALAAMLLPVFHLAQIWIASRAAKIESGTKAPAAPPVNAAPQAGGIITS